MRQIALEKLQKTTDETEGVPRNLLGRIVKAVRSQIANDIYSIHTEDYQYMHVGVT